MDVTPRVLDFQDHRRELGANRYVYAVASRRARGLSIGINLNPGLDCSFACRYCQVRRAGPGRAEPIDLGCFEAELEALLVRAATDALWCDPPFDSLRPELRRLADLAIAGDGEPSACPTFAAVVQRLGQARARHGLTAVPLRLLTNGANLHTSGAQRGLARLLSLGGEVWFKLDAGTEGAYRQVNRSDVPFERVLKNLLATARQRPVVVQSLFSRWQGKAPADEEIEAWVARLQAVVEQGGALREVQVTTVARAPAEEGCAALGQPALERIAARARTCGLTVSIHPGRWGRRPVLVTAGATRNPLDSMRSVSAHSSGGTGVAIARALQADHAVHLLASPEAGQRAEAAGIEAIEPFGSTRDLMGRVERWVRAHPAGAVVHAAAVGDYEAETSAGKVESGRPTWSLDLHPTPKILDHIRGWAGPGLVLVSFKAAPPGTGDARLVEIAAAQRARSGSDLVFANVLGRLDRGLAIVGADGVRWYDTRAEAVAALVTHPLLDG